jgi:hypothetical protein
MKDKEAEENYDEKEKELIYVREKKKKSFPFVHYSKKLYRLNMNFFV